VHTQTCKLTVLYHKKFTHLYVHLLVLFDQIFYEMVIKCCTNGS